MTRKVLYGPHYEVAPDNWPEHLAGPGGIRIAKALSNMEMFREVKAINPEAVTAFRQFHNDTGRWREMAADNSERANQAAEEYIREFLDSLITNSEWVDYAESINEQYATHDLPGLYSAVEFDRAFIRVLGRLCPGVKPVVFTAPCGNPDHDEYGYLVDLARECEAAGGAFGYHSYWSVVNKVSTVGSFRHQRDLHMRWNEIDKYLVGQGIRVKWMLGEAGPIGATGDTSSKDFGYWQKPNDGWRNQYVWNGQMSGYIGDLDAYDALIAQTLAYREGRFLGYVLFTCPPGKSWKEFKLTGGDWSELAEHAKAKPTLPAPVGILDPPAPTPPPIVVEPEPVEGVIDVTNLLPTNGSYGTRDPLLLQAHVVHHSGAVQDSTPKAIADWHVVNPNGPGWPGIAYTYFIRQDGQIYQVNRLETLSAGVWKHNDIYLSTCLTGDFRQGRRPTLPQLESLVWLHNEHIPDILGFRLPILGHKECLEAQTECPGDSWDWHEIDLAVEPEPDPDMEPAPYVRIIHHGVRIELEEV